MTAPTTPNAALAYKVLDHIDAHPEQWNQGLYIGKAECGTVGCFAGWVCLLSGEKPSWSAYDADDSPTAWLENPGHNAVPVPDRAEQLLRADRWVSVEGEDSESDGDGGWDLFGASNTREQLGWLVAEIFGPRPDGGEGGSADGEPS